MKNLFLVLLATFTFSMAPVTFAEEGNGAEGTEQGEDKKKKDSADC